MTSEKYIKAGKITALVSFLIGTLIFGIYYFTSSEMAIYAGYIFVILAGLVNLIILGIILILAYKDSKNRKKLLSTSGLMLLNIPVVLIYTYLAVALIFFMRITFTNTTQTTLTDINIVGCAGGYIDKLEVGQSKTVWVGLIDDCSINVEYSLNGEPRKEEVVPYATSFSGQKIKHKIGGENDNHI